MIKQKIKIIQIEIYPLSPIKVTSLNQLRNCLTYPIAYPNMEAVINLSIYPLPEEL